VTVLGYRCPTTATPRPPGSCGRRRRGSRVFRWTVGLGDGWPAPRIHAPLFGSNNSKQPRRVSRHPRATTGRSSNVQNHSLRPYGIKPLADVPFLVVEDDPASARLVAAVLATEGVTDVHVAHSAEEALAVLHDEFIRVLIVDVVLPGLSGLVLVRRVKSEPATRHIIAIATSAWDEPGLATDAIDSGCVAFVPKPIEFDTLLAALRATLAQAASSASEAGTGRDS
jgi:CheY-like chemotaxis protein